MISHALTTWIILLFLLAATLIGLGGLLTRKNTLQTTGCVSAAIAFLLQTASFFLGFHKSFQGGLSAGAYLQIVAWFTTLAGLFFWLKLRQRTALTFAAPLCAALFAMSLPYLEQTILLPQTLRSSFYVLHIGFLFTSLALMAVAFIASSLFLFLERRIKSKQRIKGFMQDMPALSVFDSINKVCILACFPLYTIGILSGLLRSKPVYGATLSGDPKEIVSLIIWALLAFVFHNRLAASWTGKKPALTMICIFLLSLFSLLVVNTLMPSHHSFMGN
ncbi:MAG: cytochrome c biogenesis protein [Desulfovibrio sp.]|nr:cytochrome c biogenesis protein [Desulfovibrio sp.]